MKQTTDLFHYHAQRTLKALDDEMAKARTTKAKLEVAQMIDKLLYTMMERETRLG